MRNNTVRKMAVNAMVAALYFALSLPFMTLIFGPVQLRISEAFTLLPVFSATPIAGLTLGCVLVNALLLAAFLTYHLRNVRFKNLPLLSALMPVLTNGIIIGLELTFVMSGGFSLPVFLINAGQVALGEAVACFVLGLPMVRALEKTGVGKKIFCDSLYDRKTA